MHTTTVLVVGSERDARTLVGRLQQAGFGAWSDRLGGVAGDSASFAWADALVLLEQGDHAENLRLVRQFAGPKILVTAAALASADRAALLDGGLDTVMTTPCDDEALTARLRRMLCSSPRTAGVRTVSG
jgi:DNA-binding response OmpR family regulator